MQTNNRLLDDRAGERANARVGQEQHVLSSGLDRVAGDAANARHRVTKRHRGWGSRVLIDQDLALAEDDQEAVVRRQASHLVGARRPHSVYVERA